MSLCYGGVTPIAFHAKQSEVFCFALIATFGIENYLLTVTPSQPKNNPESTCHVRAELELLSTGVSCDKNTFFLSVSDRVNSKEIFVCEIGIPIRSVR